MQYLGRYVLGGLFVLTVMFMAACSRQAEVGQNEKSHFESGVEKLKAKDYAGAEAMFKLYLGSVSSFLQGAKKVMAEYHQADALGRGYNLIKGFESRAKNLPSLDKGEFYRMLGVVAMQDKSTKQDALVYFAKGVKADPSNHGLLNDYAFSLAEMEQDLEKALDLVYKAIAYKPNEGRYFDTLGWIYYKQGKYQAALKELTYAAAAVRDVAEIRYHLAETYVKLNRISDAKVELEKVLAMNPDLEPALELKKKLGVK